MHFFKQFEFCFELNSFFIRLISKIMFHPWAQFGVGHRGRVPHFFLLGFVFGEVSKLNVTFHVLCEDFFMLDVAHSHVDVETEFDVVSLLLIFL